MDLGTNMFHLLITEGDRTIVHEQDAVKLGEGGINKGFIARTPPFERGIQTMQRFAKLITAHGCKRSQGQLLHQQCAMLQTAKILLTTYRKRPVSPSKSSMATRKQLTSTKGSKRRDACPRRNQHYRRHRRRQRWSLSSAMTRKSYWKQSFRDWRGKIDGQASIVSDPIPPDSINALKLYFEDCLQDPFRDSKKTPD